MTILNQLGIVFACGLLGELIAYYLPFTMPASVIGLLLLLCAVRSKLLPEEKIKPLADFLSKNMAFFFLPSAVNIIQGYPLLKDVLLPVIGICLISTVLTFAVTYAVTGFIQKSFQNSFRKE